MKKFFLLILSIANAVVTIIYIALIPDDIIPTHYGINGAADTYSPKWTMLIMPVILLFFGIFYAIYIAVTENNADYKNNKKYVGKAALSTYFFLFVIFWVLTIIAANGIKNIGSFVPSFLCIVCGALIFFLSNLFAKIKRNYFFGIRVNATLNSENVWKKTHRMGGYLGVLCGLILIAFGIAGAFASNLAMTFLFIGIGSYLVLGVIIPIIYAEVLYSKEKRATRNRE